MSFDKLIKKLELKEKIKLNWETHLSRYAKYFLKTMMPTLMNMKKYGTIKNEIDRDTE